MHLPGGDLLLGRGHGAHIESVRTTNRAGPHDTGKGHRPMLHTAYPVELLLQDSRSNMEDKKNGS